MKHVFLIGAMKSGTNTLYHALASHPEVATPKKKELDYFVGPDATKPYGAYFELTPHKRMTLEGTTQYSKHPHFRHIPEAIHSLDPKSMIIYLMRDPIDRYESNIAHFMAREPDFPVEAWRESRKAETAMDNGRYFTQIGPYINRFGLERVFLGAFEDFISDQANFVARVCRFLDLDARKVDLRNEKRNPRRGVRGADAFKLGADDEKCIADGLKGEIACLEYASGMNHQQWWSRYRKVNRDA